LNIDDVLAGLDEDLLSDEAFEMEGFESPEALEASVQSISAGDSSFDGEFESDEDILAFLDSDTLFDSGPGGSEGGEGLEAVEDFVLPSEQIESEVVDYTAQEKHVADEADMDALLEEILITPENEAVDLTSNIVPSGSEPEILTDEDILKSEAFPEVLNGDSRVSEEDSDLNLVKSLMADLTDDPDEFADDDALAVDDLDALLEIPEVDVTQDVIEGREPFANTAADRAIEASEDARESTPEVEGDILGDILDMTMEDELESHPDDIESNLSALTGLDEVVGAEQENVIENTMGDDVLDSLISEETVAPTIDLPSLSDIAAAAEADAVAVETGAMTQQIMAAATTTAIGAGAATLGAKVIDQDNTPEEIETQPETRIDTEIDTIVGKEPSAEPSAIEATPETSQSHSNQETSMPVKAVKTDTILDEVTETATAGAFAELNSVVEDKAIFNERGPRIGDLVQEALRPMLKEWLDANLKGIVERAVTKEVKRISSGK
jgi:cell pole-organizing protein PopZ